MDSLTKKLLDNHFLTITKKVAKKNKAQVYLVGGFLRDLVLKREKELYVAQFLLI